MSENFVTVATFHRSFEAQLARNVLEEEGIASTLSGEITADMLPFGQAGGGDQIVLQVTESAAQRAAGILAAVAAAKLDENWEDEAESGGDVWICSICGEPISNRLSMCHSCQTPREGIRTSAPRNPAAIQQQRAPQPNSPRDPSPLVEEAASQHGPMAAYGDDIARRALLASFSGILLPFAWFYLAKLFFYPHDLSPKAMRHLYGALLLNVMYFLLGMIVCGGLIHWR